MVCGNFRFDRNRLRLLLEDQLPEGAEAEILAHLELCKQCREHLETIAAGPKWWDEAKEFLADTRTDGGVNCAAKPEQQEDGPSESAPGSSPWKTFLEPSDRPGSIGRLDGYEILELVGRGGMGVVLKALDTGLNRYVAIKLLAPELAASGAARRRFTREAHSAAAVVHPNVMPIHAVGSAGDVPYLVMPYVAGLSLQARIEQNGPLEIRDVLRIGMQIAAGLAAAHAQGLVHRDIKPANILLENGLERVFLTDFGLARAVDDASLTRTGVVAGTPHFMSPEQAEGGRVDHRSDLFSLGSVLYAMCTGRSPFRADGTMAVLRRICDVPHRNIREVNPDVPQGLSGVIDRLLSKSPDDRYSTASEVASSLAEQLTRLEDSRSRLPSGTSEAAGPPEARSRSASGTYLRRTAAAVAALAAVAAAAGIATLLLRERHEVTRNPAETMRDPALLSSIAVTDRNVHPTETSLPAANKAGPSPIRAIDGSRFHEEFSYDFRGTAFDFRWFFPMGVDSFYGVGLLQPSSDGLRVTVPHHQGDSKPNVGLAPTVTLHGDFEVTVAYELVQADVPDVGAGVGASLYVLSDRNASAAAMRRCVRPGGQQVHLAWWSVRDGVGSRVPKYQQFPAPDRCGRLRMERSGTALEFFAGDGDGVDLRELLRIEGFGTEPIVLLRMEAVTDGARSTTDVLWKSLEIRAERLVRVELPALRGGD